MKNIKGYFNVWYVDDFKKTHFTIVHSWNEIRFLLDRFDNITYNFVPANQMQKMT